MTDKPEFPNPTQELAEAGREFYRRGWVRGASGNFSVLLARRPMRLCITAAGNEIAALDDTNFLEIDDDAEILQGFGRPSDETLLHLSIYRCRPRARCVLYSQSVWGTLLSDKHFVDGAITLPGHEVLRGVTPETDGRTPYSVPIVENSSDQVALAHVIENVLLENNAVRGVYIRRHGLYAWGETVEETRRAVEILEFLFEVFYRESTGGRNG